jgi:SPP1 gp7 family putative phage head morphogenesis protein
MAFNLKAAFKALFGADSKGSQPGGVLAGVSIGSARAPRRGSRELMLAYREQPWLRAIVQRIAQDVASVPLRLLAPARPAGGGLVARAYGASGDIRRKMLDDGLQSGSLKLVEEHPFLTLLNTMNPALRSVGSLTCTQAWVDIKGEAFWILERNGVGQPIEAWPVPPHWVSETPSAINRTFRISAYGYNKSVPDSDVIWFKTPDLENPYARGSGIGESLADEIDVDEFAAKHVRDWFFNGGRPSGFVSLEGAGEDEVSRFEERWRSKYQGLGRAHQIHFTNAKIGYEDLSHTFRDQELLSLRQYQSDLMRQTFGVPPEILGIIQNSNRATIDSSYYLYSRGVLVPRLVALCDTLQALAAEWDDKLVVDFHSPVPEDVEFKKAAMVALPTNYTINEHRALAGQLPIESGDEMYVTAQAIQPGAFLSSEPAFTKSLGRWKTNATIERVVGALTREQIIEEVGSVIRGQYSAVGKRTLEQLGVSDMSAFSLINPLVKDAIQESSDRITATNDTTKQAVRDALEEGILAGEGIDKLAKRVEEVFDGADDYRARMIARTETVSSANKAKVTAFAASGVVPEKEWLSVQDGNTRDAHRSLDGDIVGLTDAFTTNEGDSTMYPGGFGKPGLDINCRCTVLPVTELREMSKAMTKAERVEAWKEFDRQMVRQETELERAMKRAYKAQREAVLDELEALFGKAIRGRRKRQKTEKKVPQMALPLE